MQKSFTDQMNRRVEIPFPPKRIISLVPSQSELLWDLGLQTQLQGITKFCIHPTEMFQHVPRVGGTKKLNIELIEKIQPDLIIGNKEENTREEIEILQNKFSVWMSDVNSFNDAIRMIQQIGEITDTAEKSSALIREIENSFQNIPLPNQVIDVVYLIWKNPYMAAGQHCFINDMLVKAGLVNKIDTGRYPEITISQLKAISPDLLILSTEPYPFSEKDVHYFQHELPHAKIWLANGEMFTWYGSRMKHAASYFTHNLARFF